MNSLEITYVFKEPGFRWLLTMSDISTENPFCISAILVAKFAITMLWYSPAKSTHGRLLDRNPHWHVTRTICLQGVSGHGGSWQGNPQMWPQVDRSSVQGCVHTDGQSPLWQGCTHLCRPHKSWRPHGRPQLKSSWNIYIYAVNVLSQFYYMNR